MAKPKKFEDYEIESAAHTLKEAQKIQKDPAMMKRVQTHLKAEQKAVEEVIGKMIGGKQK